MSKYRIDLREIITIRNLLHFSIDTINKSIGHTLFPFHTLVLAIDNIELNRGSFELFLVSQKR